MAEKKVRLKRRIPQNTKHQMRYFVAILAIVFVMFILVLRYLVWARQSDLGVSAGHEANGLFYKLEIERATFSRGEPIKVQLSVQNMSDKAVTLQFADSLEFDFIVQREVNMLFVDVPMDVWKFSAKNVPQPKPHAIVVPPGEKKVFSAMWDQTDSAGNPVKSGRYIITGTLNAIDRTESLRVRGQTN